MTIRTSDNEHRNVSLHVGTGTKITTGKEIIYCELCYHDKKRETHYNKVFSADKFNDASILFYSLHNNSIPVKDIPELFK